MAANSEIRYLTPLSVDTKKKNIAVSNCSGIKYIDYKRSRIPQEIPQRAGQNPSPPHHRHFFEVPAPCGTGCEARTPSCPSFLCGRLDEIIIF